MITVSATDLLKIVDATLATKVEPSLSDLNGRSALATVRHLLNFVRVRIEREGQVLLDDNKGLREVLEQIAEYHHAGGDTGDWTAITTALAAAPISGAGASLDEISVEAKALREALHKGLARLQKMRGQRGNEPAYRTIRAAIRAHIVKQIEAEGELVAPAFFGRGPRR